MEKCFPYVNKYARSVMDLVTLYVRFLLVFLPLRLQSHLVLSISIYVYTFYLTNYSQVSVAFIVFDAILWNNKTRDMTPFEIMTTFEGT